MARDPEKEKYWLTKIEEHKKSGLSKRKYCLTNDLNINSFDYWLKKSKSHESQSTSNFVKFTSEKANSAYLVISMNGGIRIEVNCSNAASTITDILMNLSKLNHENH